MHVLARFALGTVAVFATALLVVPPATAASHDGLLLIRGVNGSAYTSSYLISQPAWEGATVSFSFQVRNTGSTLAQFRINVVDESDVQAQLYDGALGLRPLASSPDGYYTKPIPAGGNQALTVRLVVPAGTPTYQHYSRIQLFATDGTELDYFFAAAEEPADLKGGTASDIFVRQGGQAALGGPAQIGQVMSAPTISGATAATFTVILQNSSSASASIGLGVEYFHACGASILVKDASVDVTAAAMDGTYRTPVLPKAGRKNLTVTIKNIRADCDHDQFGFFSMTSEGAFAQEVYLHVSKAY